VLDIGCGFGDTSRRLAGLVGGDGAVLGMDVAEQLRPQIEAALREALSEFVGHDGVRAAASTWIVGAKAPA